MTERAMAGANIIFPECIICLTQLQSNLITPVKCGHVFHEECLRNWRNKGEKKDLCPLCKRDATNTIKLIYDIKYCQEDNTSQEPQTLSQLLERNKYLKFKNDSLQEEIKELTEYNDKCQKTVEGFREKVEENLKNVARYKNEFLNMKMLLEEEKVKNEKNIEIIEKLKNEKKILENFKNKFEMKKKIDEETEKIILNDNIEQMEDDFEKQFYKLLNDDDEKKGLKEYFFVLQQKIMKLTQENEELNKYKKKVSMQVKSDNDIYTQLIKLSDNNHKRNYQDFLKDKKSGTNEMKNIVNNNNDNNNNTINGVNNMENNNGSKRQINAIKLKTNNNSNTEYKRLFNNPLKKKELTFLKK